MLQRAVVQTETLEEFMIEVDWVFAADATKRAAQHTGSSSKKIVATLPPGPSGGVPSGAKVSCVST